MQAVRSSADVLPNLSVKVATFLKSSLGALQKGVGQAWHTVERTSTPMSEIVDSSLSSSWGSSACLMLLSRLAVAAALSWALMRSSDDSDRGFCNG